MGIMQAFGFAQSSLTRPTEELPQIFAFPMVLNVFVDQDVTNIYKRILTDAIERTHGLKDDQVALLWDNCLMSESQSGLIAMLAKGMADKADLFIVYDKALKLVRKADTAEMSQIRADYKARNESNVGVFLSFKNYDRTDFVKLYSGLEYATVASLHKSMSLSKAIQFKMANMRSAVALSDSADTVAQAKAMAIALGKGLDILMDGGDVIETAKPDLTATNSSLEFIARKQSFYLGLPAAWVMGTASSGISDTGKGDSKAIERGLRAYYYAILRPVLFALFGAKTTFNSEDFDLLDSATKLLTVFEATGDELISQDNKRTIVNKIFGLPSDAKGDPPAKPLAITGQNGPGLVPAKTPPTSPVPTA